ncbi:MAG: GTP cyclohydrolase II [Ferrovibrionaceae bacterium]
MVEAQGFDKQAVVLVPRAIGEFRRGRPVAISDENGTLIAYAAEELTPETLASARAAAGTEGPLLALTARRAARLHIGPTGHDTILLPWAERYDLRLIRHLADPVDDFDLPFSGPFARLKAAPRPAAVAAVALAKQAQLLPAALFYAAEDAPDDAVSLSAAAVLAYPAVAAAHLRIVGEARVPLADAETTRLVAFRPEDGGVEHIAIVVGDPPKAAPVLARLHSECFTGDLLGSLRCDCGEQLRGAIRVMQEAGGGVVLYLAQEGRGIGLINKLRAYRLQDQGFDTVEANERIGFDPDERVFLVAATMLRLLGYEAVRLMTNNPDKVGQLSRHGITVVERVAHQFAPNPHNQAYLDTKKKRSGHYL